MNWKVGLKPALRSGVMALSVACALGCDPGTSATERSLTQPTSAGGADAIGLTSAAAFLDGDDASVFMVGAGIGGAPTVLQRDIGHTPVLAQRRNAHDELLVLTHGRPASRKRKAEGPALYRVGATGNAAALPLGAHFTRLAQSDDGLWAVAFYGLPLPPDDLLVNPNQVAVIDLNAGTVLPLTSRSLGSIPRRIFFSPDLLIAGQPHRFAIIASDSYVSLLDLSEPGRTEITLPLTLSGDGRVLDVQQIVFDPGALGSATEPARAASLYLRIKDVDDVYGVALVPATPTSLTDNDFTVALSILAAGTRPNDMALYGRGAATRLLTVSAASRQVNIIDPASSASTAIPLQHGAAHILVFEGTSPTDNRRQTRAVLAGDDNDPTLTFLDLEGIDQLRGRNADDFRLTAGAQALVSLASSPNLALVMHKSGLTLVDLRKRQVSPILTNQSSLTLGSTETSKVWVLSPDGSRVGFVDIGTSVTGDAALATGEISLDANARQIIPILGADGVARVLVPHAAPEGYVTIFDATAPSRTTARSLRGFFAVDLLGRTRRAQEDDQ